MEINKINLDIIINNITKKISYYTTFPHAVATVSAGLGGLISTLFAIFYFDVINIDVSQTFLNALKALITIYWVMISVQYGVLTMVGYKGFTKPVIVLTKYIATRPNVHVRENLTEQELKELLRYLTSFPKFISFNVSIWIITLIIIIVSMGVVLEGFNTEIMIAILSISSLILFILFCFSMVISELVTTEVRAECKKIMHERNIQFKDRPTSTVQFKMIFFLIMLIASLILSNVLMYNNHENISRAVAFSIFAVIVFIILARIIFISIYNSLRQIEMASNELIKGGAGLIFSGALDQEFINVIQGINKATKTITDYRDGLEEKVNKRTLELNNAFSALTQKEAEIEAELDIAADIQRGIIPNDIPSWNGIIFASYYQPMVKVSGDYFDVFKFTNNIFVLMADVSGHGVPAALITMTAKQAFSTSINEYSNPAEVFKKVNNIIMERVKTSDYLSAFLVKIDYKHNIIFANAAHPKSVHYINSRNEYLLLDTEGMFIGSIEEANDTYENKETRLQSGDRFYLYTDGLLEYKNEGGEEFGLDRFIDTLRSSKNDPLNIQIHKVAQAVKTFAKSAPARDDISILAFELEAKWARFIELFNSGIKYLKKKELIHALESFLNAQEIVPSYTPLKQQLAIIYYHIGDTKTAELLIEEYIAEFPNDKKGIQLAINIYVKLNNLNKTDFYITKLRELNKLDESTEGIENSHN